MPGIRIQNPCNQFKESGQCTYGDTCKFPHDSPSGPGKPGTKGLKSCNQFLESGVCSYGSICKFSHGSSRLKTKGSKKNARKTKKRRSHRQDLTLASDPVENFFADRYPDFDFDPHESIVQEFYRMCDFFAWDKKGEDRQEAHEDFKTAMVLKFNDFYGTDANSIECWHRLCVALDIDPLPQDIKDCRKEVRKLHVNLVDLVDSAGQKFEQFDSLDELRDYTMRTGKYFPKESAYAGGLLKFLLREIHNRHHGGGGRGGRRGGSGAA